MDDLQQQLATARSALVNDMGGAVDSAKTLADWRQHFRAHPLVFCGAAAALGFLLVPRRRPAAPPMPVMPWPPESVSAAMNTASMNTPSAAENRSVIKSLLLMAATNVAREAASFAARRGQDWLRNQVQAMAAKHKRQPTDPSAEMEFDDYSHP
jgi:short subunit dehydrogenase-like uncharacterized protein